MSLYYYHTNEGQAGPYSKTQLKGLYDSAAIPADTQVWSANDGSDMATVQSLMESGKGRRVNVLVIGLVLAGVVWLVASMVSSSLDGEKKFLEEMATPFGESEPVRD